MPKFAENQMKPTIYNFKSIISANLKRKWIVTRRCIFYMFMFSCHQGETYFIKQLYWNSSGNMYIYRYTCGIVCHIPFRVYIYRYLYTFFVCMI